MIYITAPSLIVLALDLRTEIETTVTTWLGVAGYERTITWARIPVYQNFINFGSPIPIMANIANTPLAILGMLLPVQLVQQTFVFVSFIWASYFTATSGALRSISLTRLTPISALHFLATAHYTYSNDWSELILSSIGLYILILLFIETNLNLNVAPTRQATMLWLGASLASLDHFGHAGVTVITMTILFVGSLRHALFRNWAKRVSTILYLSLLAVLITLIWFPSLNILLQNSVDSNPRPRPALSSLLDLASLGLSTQMEALLGSEIRDFPNILSANRAIFFGVLPLFILAFRGLLASRKRPRDDPFRLVHESLFMTSVVLAMLAIFAGSVGYPLRPSQDYFFRDAILPLLIFGIIITDANQMVLQDEPRSSDSRKRFGLSILALAVGFAALSLSSITAKRHGWFVSESQADEVIPGNCEALGAGTTIWSEYSPELSGRGNSTLWRRNQPINPFRPSDCTILQMIRSDQNSIAGWLKIHQTSSDGKAFFELDNITVSLTPGLLDNFDDVYVYDGRSLQIESLATSDESDDIDYVRCPNEACVLRILNTEDGGQLVWNYNENLLFSGRGLFEQSDDGFFQFKGPSGQSGIILYQTPLSQKFGALASWALWVGVPLTIFGISRCSRDPK